MSLRSESGNNRLDDAARAGWLYYIAGNTQEEIAAKLGVHVTHITGWSMP